MGWHGRFSGLSRASGLLLMVMMTAILGKYLGRPVHWEIAITYGIFLGISHRWPIILPVNGIRLTLHIGLIFEGLWSHNLHTALVILLLGFTIRLLITPLNRMSWNWSLTFAVAIALISSYGIGLLVSSDISDPLASWAPLDAGSPWTLLVETKFFIQVYMYWIILNTIWTGVVGPTQGRTLLMESFLRLQQTWWVPLLHLMIAWGMHLTRQGPVPLMIPAGLGLTWLQYWLGMVFSIINQDRAVAELLRSFGPRNAYMRRTYQQVLYLAHSLARELELSEQEIRTLGYATLLQEHLLEPKHALPLWFSQKPTPEQMQMLEVHLRDTLRWVQQAGPLRDVAGVIQFRHASYDGQGYPDIAGDQIPLDSQILAAANAIFQLTEQFGDMSAEGVAKAVAWINQHAAHRFNPRVRGAMMRVLGESKLQADREDTLTNMVRQLQELVSDVGRPSTLMTGFRRIWYRFRGKTGLAPQLPKEVLAVARMASFFASSTSIDQTANIVVTAVGELVGAKAFLALSEGDGADLELSCKASYGIRYLKLSGRPISIYGGMISRAILDQEPMQIADVQEISSPLSRDLARVEGIRSVLFIPLVGRKRTTGLLVVGMVQYHWFTPREVGLLSLMAGQAAIALENAKLMAEVAERLEHISALKAFTDTLLDNLSASIIVIDPDGKLALANAAARAMFGAHFSLEVGQPLPENCPVAPQVYHALTGKVEPETDVVDVAWESMILEIQAAPLQDANKSMLGAISVTRDVTRLRAMEQQVRRSEKLSAMGQLAASAAHEIRNPLTSIRGFIQLMQARASNAEGEFVNIILNEIDHIDEIIRSMRQLTFPVEPRRTEVFLTKLLHELLLLHQSQMEQRGIKVVKHFDTSTEPFLLDRNMFRQVLHNLILNALQAMPQGGTLRLTVRKADPDHAILEVADTGVGISEENLKHLFEPFFTTKEEGTGMGLARCHNFIQMHNGRIDVRSAVGKGTTFTITFPVR